MRNSALPSVRRKRANTQDRRVRPPARQNPLPARQQSSACSPLDPPPVSPSYRGTRDRGPAAKKNSPHVGGIGQSRKVRPFCAPARARSLHRAVPAIHGSHTSLCAAPRALWWAGKPLGGSGGGARGCGWARARLPHKKERSPAPPSPPPARRPRASFKTVSTGLPHALVPPHTSFARAPHGGERGGAWLACCRASRSAAPSVQGLPPPAPPAASARRQRA